MAIRTLDDNLNIISALPDEPTEVGGMGPGELKAAFDEAGNIIKGYVNDKLIPDTEAEIAGAVAAAEIASGNIPTGGASGQVLTKSSSEDYDYGWQDPSGASEATPNAVIKRDANGRAQVAEPEAAQDIATKGYVENINSVGTVNMGYANPFGEKGLLCNGATVSSATYPELHAMLETSILGEWNTFGGQSTSRILKLNGYYIGLIGGSNIYVSTNPVTLGWTAVPVAGMSAIHEVAYGNGYWVAVGNNGKFAYLNNATPIGTWTQNTSNSGVWSTNNIAGVAYGNGYWVVTYNNCYFAYAASPTGVFTSVGAVNVSSYATTVFEGDLKFENGVFVVGARYVNTYSYMGVIFSTTGTSWSYRDPNLSSYSHGLPYAVTYQNGYWLFGVTISNTNERQMYIYYTTNPATAAFSSVLIGLWDLVSTAPNIFYTGREWIASTEKQLLVNTNSNFNDGVWDSSRIPLGFSTYIIKDLLVDSAERILIATSSGHPKYIDKCLPILDSNFVNYYIKALP